LRERANPYAVLASHTVDHAEWLSLAGIEATLLLLAGEEIAALDHRPPEPAPRGSAMATVDPDGEHVRIDLEMSGGRASLRLDPLLALRLGGEVLEAVGLVMRPMLTGLRRAAR